MRIKQTILTFLLLGLGLASAQTLIVPKGQSRPKVSIAINHFQSTASIQFEKDNTNEYTCRIHTSDNKLLMKFVKESTKSEYLIPLDHLRSGTYLLSVESEEGKYTYKFTR